MLNKTKGNMYEFVTHTFNILKGKCSHDCQYCYMKIFKLNKLRFDEKELETDLGENNFIFVGSSTDMFAQDICINWIKNVLNYCSSFPKNKYLFQSKNPLAIWQLREYLPVNCVVGTTIETNRRYDCMGNTPDVKERARIIGLFSDNPDDTRKQETMITLEPLLKFDLNELVELIRIAKPSWVNIGIDSKNHNLPEPTREEIFALIKELAKFTKIVNKENLKRIVGDMK